MNKTEKMLAYKQESIQKIGDYLISRPYAEVEKLVEILKSGNQVDVTFAPPQSPVDPPAGGEDSPAETVAPV